jgi:hypothetical protein
MFHLVVTRPFGKYAVGQKITDQSEVAALLAGKNKRNFVKVHADAPKVAPKVFATK